MVFFVPVTPADHIIALRFYCETLRREVHKSRAAQVQVTGITSKAAISDSVMFDPIKLLSRSLDLSFHLRLQQIRDSSLMQERHSQQAVVRSPILRRSSTGCVRRVVADPCHETVASDVIEGYSIGETDFECWGRLWKATASDPEVDPEEWVTYLEQIEEHFRTNYENFPDEMYFWGNFSGDRTLDLKIAKPTVLTARLLSDLQNYLQMNGQKMWRIRIPIYFKSNDSHRVVVVYPHAIDIPLVLLSGSGRENCGANEACPNLEFLHEAETGLRSSLS